MRDALVRLFTCSVHTKGTGITARTMSVMILVTSIVRMVLEVPWAVVLTAIDKSNIAVCGCREASRIPFPHWRWPEAEIPVCGNRNTGQHQREKGEEHEDNEEDCEYQYYSVLVELTLVETHQLRPRGTGGSAFVGVESGGKRQSKALRSQPRAVSGPKQCISTSTME